MDRRSNTPWRAVTAVNGSSFAKQAGKQPPMKRATRMVHRTCFITTGQGNFSRVWLFNESHLKKRSKARQIITFRGIEEIIAALPDKIKYHSTFLDKIT